MMSVHSFLHILGRALHIFFILIPNQKNASPNLTNNVDLVILIVSSITTFRDACGSCV